MRRCLRMRIDRACTPTVLSACRTQCFRDAVLPGQTRSRRHDERERGREGRSLSCGGERTRSSLSQMSKQTLSIPPPSLLQISPAYPKVVTCRRCNDCISEPFSKGEGSEKKNKMKNRPPYARSTKHIRLLLLIA